MMFFYYITKPFTKRWGGYLSTVADLDDPNNNDILYTTFFTPLTI